MGPAVKIHHVPEFGRVELVEIGDDGDEDAVDPFVMQRAREVMVVDQKTLLAGSDDDRHHVMAEEIGQLFRILLLP